MINNTTIKKQNSIFSKNHGRNPESTETTFAKMTKSKNA